MSSSSREDSPDWLRHFQAPTQAAVSLSSDSQSPVSDDEDNKNLSELFCKQVTESSDREKDDYNWEKIPVSKTLNDKSPGKNKKGKQAHGRRRLRGDPSAKEGKRTRERAVESETLEEPIPTSGRNSSVWSLSSDSDSSSESRSVSTDIVLGTKFPDNDKFQEVPIENDEVATDDCEESLPGEVSTVKTTRKLLKKKENETKKLEKVDSHMNGNAADLDIEEDTSEKHRGLHLQVSSSRLPLVLSEKVLRSKALVECEGDSIDLSGDAGAVGRVVISDDSSENHEMLLDLKGTVYRATIVPSRTFCVVNFGQTEAKIEAIMNDFIQLKPQSNVYEAETMVEGTLEGLLSDLEDEVDELPKTAVVNQNEDAEKQSHGKTKQKAEKASVAVRKKVKAAAGKMPKKVKKKSLAPKRSRTKK